MITVGELESLLKDYSENLLVIDSMFTPIEGEIRLIEKYPTGRTNIDGTPETIYAIQIQ